MRSTASHTDIMTDTHKMIVSAVLAEIGEHDSFSIFRIDPLIEMVGESKDSAAYKALRALHCVSMRNMPTPLVNSLPELILSALGEGVRPCIA